MEIISGKVTTLVLQKQNKVWLGEEYAKKKFRNNSGYLSFSKLLESFKKKRVTIIIAVDKGWEAEIKYLNTKKR